MKTASVRWRCFILMGAGVLAVPQVSAQVLAQNVDQSPTLSATGYGQVQVQVRGGGMPTWSSTVLNVTMTSRVMGTNQSPEISAIQDKVVALQQALQQVGVPTSNIRLTNFNVSPIYGPVVPPPPGTPGASPSIRGYTINESLQVSTNNLEQFNAALQAALKAGATSANLIPTLPPGGFFQPESPTTEALTTAINQATLEAKTLAQASAKAAGVTLGSLRRVSVQPFPGLSTPNNSVWRVQVNVTYDIAKPTER